MFNNMDAYQLSIKATIGESQLRIHAQAELKAADKPKVIVGVERSRQYQEGQKHVIISR
jgi:hypothetical protein